MDTLRQAGIGETVRVVKLHGEGAVKQRIMDMGITRGVEVYVRKAAPLGDPVEVSVRGYELTIRKADADRIEVEQPLPAAGPKERRAGLNGRAANEMEKACACKKRRRRENGSENCACRQSEQR